MLIDLTLEVTPETKKDAQGNKTKALSGHLGTHFDVMDKEFPLSYAMRPGIVFDVLRAVGEIFLSDREIDRVGEGMCVLFYTGFIEEAGYGTKRYALEHPVLSYELIDALLERKVSLIGRAVREAFEREGCRVEVIDILPGDHYVGDISQQETLEAFAYGNGRFDVFG